MSRKTIRKIEKIISQENVRGIKKDLSTGLYRIVTQEVKRDQYTNEVTCNSVEESEELYEITSVDDFERFFKYQDIDGSEKIVYLKRVVQENVLE